MLISLVVGFLADPVRKIVIGEPIYLSVIVIVPVIATMIGVRRHGHRLSLRPIYRWNPVLRVPLTIFVLLVLLQSVNALLTTGSPMIPVIGILAYLAPIPGIMIGYHYANDLTRPRRFLRWYVGLVATFAVGILLARQGFQWDLLESVGQGLVAFSPTGERLDLEAGFFRAPEIAAWHVAMGVCFLLVLLFTSRRPMSMVLIASALSPLFLAALVFTGRRKGLVEVALFLTVYLASLAYFRRGAVKTAFTLAVLGLAVAGWASLAGMGETLGFDPYFARGTDIGGREIGRFRGLSVDALQWVIQRNGVLGSGTGTGSQGAQYFGGGAAVVGSAAEGGIGKVVAELGVPGLVVLLWLAIAFFVHIWSIARLTSRLHSLQAHFAYGLMGVVIANALTYVIGHQVFGDTFVLYVIGLTTGFLMAVPRMGRVRMASRPQAGYAPVGATLGDRSGRDEERS